MGSLLGQSTSKVLTPVVWVYMCFFCIVVILCGLYELSSLTRDSAVKAWSLTTGQLGHSPGFVRLFVCFFEAFPFL